MAFSYAKASTIAVQLNVEPATVLAVAEVESGGRHDLPDGRPQILFEAHWFSKLTKGKFDATHPNISSPVWDRSLYKGGTAEWGRLNAAIELDAEAALQSASWGLFQIMGFNYRACGFRDVASFVSFIKGPDDHDMQAFCTFVNSNPKILKAMQEKDWGAFALHYNGPGAVASYSAKMADAYAKFAGQHDRQEEGPPLPVADPTLKPKVLTPGNIAKAAGATIPPAVILAENAKPALDAIQNSAETIQQATTAWSAIKDAFGTLNNGHVLTVVCLVLALGVFGFVAYRIIQNIRQGKVAT